MAEFYPPALVALIEAACARLEARLQALPAHLAQRAADWLAAFTKGQGLAAAMLAPDSFPLALPAWGVAESAADMAGTIDEGLQSDLIDSVLAMYLFIRLNDDVMDGDGSGYPALLPLTGVLHSAFEAPLHRHFGPEHPFWRDFDAIWARSADVTVRDALATSVSLADFDAFAGLKCVAGAIPAVAAAHALQRPEWAGAWMGWVDELSRWHQFGHDLFDWKKDLEQGAVTVITSEALVRKSDSETAAAWMFREGLEWGQAEQERRTTDLLALATHLKSASLMHYMAFRRERQTEKFRSVSEGLKAARALFGLGG